MAFRLALDVVRRKWMMIVLAVLQLHVVHEPISKLLPSTNPLSWFLMSASFLAPMAGEALNHRPLFQLPITRRSWWLARWWLGTAGAVIVSLLALSWTRWRMQQSAWTSPEEIGFFLVIGFLYRGCSMAFLTTRFGRTSDEPATMATLWMLPAFFAYLTLPLLVAPYLPKGFSDINGAWAIVLGVMAVISAKGYLYQPAIAPRADRGLTPARIPRVYVPPPSSDEERAARAARRRLLPFWLRILLRVILGNTDEDTRPRFSDRLTGLKLVAWEEAGRRLKIYTSIMILLMFVRLFVSMFRSVPALGEFLRLADALPFSSRVGHATEPVTYGFLFLFASFFNSWVATKLRPLRTLPLSSTTLSVIPAGLGLLSASMLWIVLMVLHLVFVRSVPVTLRVDLFLAFAAMAAITETMRFIAPGSPTARPIIALIPWAIVLLAFTYFLDSLPSPVGPAWSELSRQPMMLGSLLLLAASFVSMRLAIARSSRIYRPLPTPVRFGS